MSNSLAQRLNTFNLLV